MAVEDFLAALDGAWGAAGYPRFEVRIIGAGALILQTDYGRGTKDADVLETSELDAETRSRLLAVGGPETPLSRKHGVYIDIVANGIPFLPHPPKFHARHAEHLDLGVLDVVDVVVAKLKRFSANDQSDILAMIERDLVSHETLVARFESAKDGFSCDARAEEELPRYLRNLNAVERDMLGVDESDVELPPWI